MGRLVPTCVWRTSAGLVLALDERFGPPHDAYVNGSQVWLRDDGPGGMTIEWRLHPVAAYRRPPSVGTYELFEATADALAGGTAPPAALEELWDGLEAFAAYGDEIEPAILAAAATEALGLPPHAVGVADHDRIGDQWERTGGRTSIIDGILEQFSGGSVDPRTQP